MERSDRPVPPEALDADIRAFLVALGDEDAETIRSVASYAEDLAGWAEVRSAASETDDGVDPTPRADDRTAVPIPDDVPETATVSVTEIGGTEYYYYQWRDGDRIRSKTVER